jgi:hypothetical protein
MAENTDQGVRSGNPQEIPSKSHEPDVDTAAIVNFASFESNSHIRSEVPEFQAKRFMSLALSQSSVPVLGNQSQDQRFNSSDDESDASTEERPQLYEHNPVGYTHVHAIGCRECHLASD